MWKKLHYFYVLIFSTFLLIYIPSTSSSLTVTFNGPTELRTYSFMILEPSLEDRDGYTYAVYDPVNAIKPVCKEWDYTSGTLYVDSGEEVYLNLGFTGSIDAGGETSKAWNTLEFKLFKEYFEIANITEKITYIGGPSTRLEIEGFVSTPFIYEEFYPDSSGNGNITVNALIKLLLYPGTYSFSAEQNSGTFIDYFETPWYGGDPPIFGASADFSQTGFLNFTTDPGGMTPKVICDLYDVTAPVPEPSTIVILVIGLLSVVGVRTRLKK